MKIESETTVSTLTKLTITVASRDMEALKNTVEKELASQVRLDGFRQGKVPLQLARTKLDQTLLQETFLQRFVPQVVTQVLTSKQIQPMLPPQVNLTKFIPFESLELQVEVNHLGKTEIADYRQLSDKLPVIKVNDSEIEDILTKIRFDFATYREVKRAAIKGDRVWFDLQAFDKQQQIIAAASAENQFLILGQQTSASDFANQLFKVRSGQNLEFKLTADKVNLRHLGKQQINFKVAINRVEAVDLPKLDQTLISKIGPFKDLAALRQFVKQQITQEKQNQAEMIFQGQLVAKLAKTSTIEIPSKMIEAEIEKLTAEHQADLERQNLSLQNWQKAAKINDDQYKQQLETKA